MGANVKKLESLSLGTEKKVQWYIDISSMNMFFILNNIMRLERPIVMSFVKASISNEFKVDYYRKF